ncbi:MAG: Trm112 family protein [Gammaproteobacteria bacterium]|nr:MAG: Trm112 family protein [Gammaproteobacteria bacterium]
MPVNAKLLEILCCPQTKIPVEVMEGEELAALNKKVEGGGIKYIDGSMVEEPLVEALITKNREVIYRVDDDTPVMIYEKGIMADQ